VVQQEDLKQKYRWPLNDESNKSHNIYYSMANVLAKRCLASAASNAFSATRQTRLQHVPVRMQSFAPMTRSFGASSRGGFN
jgi:hypothetical protein